MNIISVVVAFNPDVKSLISLCKELKQSKSHVIIVDNTRASNLHYHDELQGCHVVALKENTGIAYAQNIGIKYAILNRADIVVIFDQDSKIGPDFLPKLVAPLTPGEPRVVSPVCLNESDGSEIPTHKLNIYGLPINLFSQKHSQPYFTDIVISSGSASTVATYELVGLMDEDFFIDFVDIEWCLRCKDHNVPIQVVPHINMKHTIGEATVKCSHYKGVVHSTIRSYYKLRNCFLLFRKSHVPLLFSFRQLASALIHNLIQIAFVKNKVNYLHNYFNAIIHGVLGVRGKKPNS